MKYVTNVYYILFFILNLINSLGVYGFGLSPLLQIVLLRSNKMFIAAETVASDYRRTRTGKIL